MRSMLLLCVLLAGCGSDSSDEEELASSLNPSKTTPGIGRVQDLDQAAYASTYCTSTVSGSAGPVRVLIDVKCEYNGSVTGKYVLSCDAGERYCLQEWADGRKAEAAFSNNLTQIILSTYDKGGARAYSESLLKRR